MDWDDAVPPPVRRASREALHLQTALDDFLRDHDDFDRAHDDAAPPPIRRLRAPSSGASSSKTSTKSPVASPKSPGRPPSRTVVLPYIPYNDAPPPSPSRTPAPRPDPPRSPQTQTSKGPAPASSTQVPPLPCKSPRRLRLDLESKPERSKPDPQSSKQDPQIWQQPLLSPRAQNFSHPFNKLPERQSRPPLLSSTSQPSSQPKYANTSSFRNPPRPLSYKNNYRMPHNLRRWSSLETIDSVQTHELSRENSLEGSESTHTTDTTTTSNSRRQYLSFYNEDDDEDEDEDPMAGSLPSTPSTSFVPLPRTPSENSRPRSSASSSIQSTSTTTQGSGPRKSTAASIIRKLRGKSEPEPLLTPESLEIEKRISLDQRSHSNSSNSIMTISSGRPSDGAFAGFSQGSGSQLSVSSKDWRSSNFDTSGLSEAELKKCRKKGINPALYAEMKAARKGRFVSPIGGNTFI